eukprot:TRINITY_DN4296_c0_g2_i2.p1 TRINITY_DN4296_c0_g2~~TRINITY_DN4296_c0_g2_i2.p1  ORF type:complete len:324 (-),score=47.02 TRINITY_DN4296_c0_g2_i2:125-1096(-)
MILFMLCSTYFTMALSFSIAYAMGCWYFHQGDPTVPAAPVGAGLKLALLSRNGAGVCTQAAVVMTGVDYMHKKVFKNKCPCLDPLWCFMAALYACFGQCLRTLTSYALFAVALDGGGFCETSQKALSLLGAERTARFAIIDTSLGWLLRLQAQALSTAMCIVCWAIVDSVEGLGIFDSIITGTKSAYSDLSPQAAQWFVVLIVALFYWFMRRPLFTVAFVLILYTFFGGWLGAFVSSACAALLVGSIASLVLHQFAEAAVSALGGLLYCWVLDEALGGGQGVAACREQVASLYQESSHFAAQYMPDYSVAFLREGLLSVLRLC